jgi:hypothetical protein
MASIKTGTGASLAIGTTLAVPNGDQATYETDSYTPVGNVEHLGEFGDERNKVTFVSLADGRVNKARGAADAGDMEVVWAHTTAEGGQLAMAAAFAAASQATDEFNFRVLFNDQISTNPTKRYFRGRIGSLRVDQVTNDGVILVKAMIWITTTVLEVAAA